MTYTYAKVLLKRKELIMEEKFYAKIYVTTFPNPILVEVMAKHTAEAKAKIESMYKGTFKSWYMSPRTRI